MSWAVYCGLVVTSGFQNINDCIKQVKQQCKKKKTIQYQHKALVGMLYFERMYTSFGVKVFPGEIFQLHGI